MDAVVLLLVGAALATAAFLVVVFFTDLHAYLAHGGEKGVQRPVLPPGSIMPIHPVAFLVVTSREVFGSCWRAPAADLSRRRGWCPPHVHR